MKFKSALITQASGSIGGITFATGIGGMFMRARAIPVNPNTQAQNAVRSSLGALTSVWNTLTSPQRNAWNAYAAQVPLPDTFGDPRLVSGFNHFIRSNSPRVRVLGAAGLLVDAPSTYNIGATPILVSCATEISAGGVLDTQLILNIMDAPVVADPNAYILVYIAPPFNANRTFHRGPFLFSVSEAVSTAALQPITVSVTSTYAWDPAGGQGVQLRTYQSQGDGRMSGDLFVRDTSVPAVP